MCLFADGTNAWNLKQVERVQKSLPASHFSRRRGEKKMVESDGRCERQWMRVCLLRLILEAYVHFVGVRLRRFLLVIVISASYSPALSDGELSLTQRIDSGTSLKVLMQGWRSTTTRTYSHRRRHSLYGLIRLYYVGLQRKERDFDLMFGRLSTHLSCAHFSFVISLFSFHSRFKIDLPPQQTDTVASPPDFKSRTNQLDVLPICTYIHNTPKS